MTPVTVKQQQPKPWSPLQKAATDLGETPDHRIHLDGVRWDIENTPDGKTTDIGVFRDAYVNPDRIKDVSLVIKPFTENAGGLPGHALLKFEFQPDAPVVDSEGHEDSALAVSVEVHFHEGEEYNPIDDTPKPIIYQLGTWTDAIEKGTVHDKNPLQSYRLKLDDSQKKKLLLERLHASTQNHDGDLYHPVNNSCVSTLIDSVNLVIPQKQRMSHIGPDGEPDPQATIPVWSPRLFGSHGLLAQLSPDIIPARS